MDDNFLGHGNLTLHFFRAIDFLLLYYLEYSIRNNGLMGSECKCRDSLHKKPVARSHPGNGQKQLCFAGIWSLSRQQRPNVLKLCQDHLGRRAQICASRSVMISSPH